MAKRIQNERSITERALEFKTDISANELKNLLTVKIIHTLIWLFFNVVIFYLLYAVLTDKIDKWVWIGLSLFVVEGIILVAFKMACPLTIIARKYSNSTKDNFDIFLPEWLAKYNKLIYTTLLAIILTILTYKLAIR